MSGPLDRQPTKLDYASPTQFKFGIHQLPKVEFFVTAVNLPDITLDISEMDTPYKNIPVPGVKLTYGNLDVTFLADEYLENYTSLHNWITGIGFPKDRKQFSEYRDVTSNTPADISGVVKPDTIGSAKPDRAMYSDANLMVLSNKNNPIVQIDFEDMFPISLGGLLYNQQGTDVEYMSMQASFAFKIFTITPL
jgi:hypothetical protein